jgi:cobalt-zinc-cadmium efflux system protein
MEGSPSGLNLEQVKKDISVDGVMKVHDLHAWALTPQQWVLTAHVVISNCNQGILEIKKIQIL